MQVLTNNSYRKLPCENASFLCLVLKFAHLQICELVLFFFLLMSISDLFLKLINNLMVIIPKSEWSQDARDTYWDTAPV